MSDSKDKLRILLKKYLDNDCSEEEKAIVEDWYLSINKEPQEIDEKQVLEDLHDLHKRLHKITVKQINYSNIIKYSAAAIFLLAAFISIFFIKNSKIAESKYSYHSNDINPGKNRATLVIEGENPIELNEGQNGVMSRGRSIYYEDGTKIKTQNKVQIAKLSTPIAGQYKLELSDGTKIWLNAQSSVRYPTTFIGDTREIEITGEVFMEVAKNPLKPFIVTAKEQKIEVLGTSFNIDSYADNGNVYVSLNEGKLKVSNSNKNIVLKPGQQAIISDDIINIKEINAEEQSSWKDGLYIINDELLDNYLNKIERWYDVKFDHSEVKNIQLSAIIPRNAKLSEVLESIEIKTGVKFKIKGRRIEVK